VQHVPSETLVQEKKKEMGKIIEVTNKAFEQREKCLSEMSVIKTQADKEQAQFEGEWKKLGATIDQDKRNRELLRQRDMEERNRKTQEVCSLHKVALPRGVLHLEGSLVS
jgi:hypothetical protein